MKRRPRHIQQYFFYPLATLFVSKEKEPVKVTLVKKPKRKNLLGKGQSEKIKYIVYNIPERNYAKKKTIQ